MQTLLQPSASGESALIWLLQARIPGREPPSAAGLLHTGLGKARTVWILLAPSGKYNHTGPAFGRKNFTFSETEICLLNL